jgi:hypothetical protein
MAFGRTSRYGRSRISRPLRLVANEKGIYRRITAGRRLLHSGSAGIIPERVQHCVPQQYRITRAAFCQFDRPPSDDTHGWVRAITQSQRAQGTFKCRGDGGDVLWRERSISEKRPNRHSTNPRSCCVPHLVPGLPGIYWPPMARPSALSVKPMIAPEHPRSDIVRKGPCF